MTQTHMTDRPLEHSRRGCAIHLISRVTPDAQPIDLILNEELEDLDPFRMLGGIFP